MDYDVIIIGAGPAGLTCGLQLAKAGKSCLIIEQREESLWRWSFQSLYAGT